MESMTHIIVLETDGIVPINCWVFPKTNKGEEDSRKKFKDVLETYDSQSLDFINEDTVRSLEGDGCVFRFNSDV